MTGDVANPRAGDVVSRDTEHDDLTARGGYNLRPRKGVAYVPRVFATPSKPKRSRSTVKETQNTETVAVQVPITPPITPPAKRQRRSGTEPDGAGTQEAKGEEESQPITPKRTPRKTKENPYGLIAGETPYPDWESPSPQQCQEVYDILASVHVDINSTPPEKIPAPSLEVAGCGEVPSVLDGLIRTVLSGSTTFAMSDMMLQALVRKFGVLEEGIGKGSVNWNSVRTATYDEVYQQLKNGGLGSNKTKHIQAILQMVYEENMAHRSAFLEETESGAQAEVAGASVETEGQKKLEILKADQDMLSLDHMHNMETYDALKHFVRYPGVGIKTAACVTLFSLRRPCLAVDTHVFRLSKWLGWVPQKTNEDNTFGHLEFRCPDHLKYGIHQLFIQHGKTCYKCNDMSFMGTEAWNAAVCPLENLINRYSKRTAKPKEEKSPEKSPKNKAKSPESQESRAPVPFEVLDGEEAEVIGPAQDVGEQKVEANPEGPEV